MKKTLILLSAIAISMWASAQELTPQVLQNLQNSYQEDAQTKAIRNAIGGTDLKVLALNQDNLDNLDFHFSNAVYKLPKKDITNQKKSGRCWMFCTLNVIREDMCKRHNLKSFEFSENYLFFYDQLEKSNLYLENIIATRKLKEDSREIDYLLHHPIGDGGSFVGAVDLISKYGAVPAECMHETTVANATASYKPLIQAKLREFAIALRDNTRASDRKLRAIKEEQLKQIYRLLVLCYGVPPTEFTWARYDKKDKLVSKETYTPKSFAEKFVRAEMLTDYVMFMNDPTRAYYKVYDAQEDRHVYEGANWCYINLPVEEIQKMCIASIKDSVAIYTGSDVGKDRNSAKGYLSTKNYNYEELLGINFPMNKAERIRTFTSASTHAMALVAVDLDAEGKPTKWLLENSWGDKSGWKGYFMLDDGWFHEYIFRFVLERKYVPQEYIDLLDTKHIMIPAWDPMAQGEVE